MRPPDTVPRRHLLRAAVLLVVVLLLLPSGISALTHEPTSLQRGTVEEPADGPTYVGIQGFHYQGEGSLKKPARVVAVGERGTPEWTYLGEEPGDAWVYDVDPLPNGNLLVVSTMAERTLVYELDTDTRERVWTEEFDLHDTHDVDLINGDELLIANMRNYDDESGESDDRLLVYNRTQREFVWEWRFKDHYPEDTDGGHGADWTHVNDVDKIDDGRYMASPRNFDQVIVVNRSTDEIEMRLGQDDDYSTLFEQHNPDYLESEEGRPTVLVGDSENDRVVEYERHCSDVGSSGIGEADPERCQWKLTWKVGGQGQLNWPRDADRLPNGNTLVTDSLNNRVIEITPEGEIVWEFYATWGPYDGERASAGDGSNGPTITDLGAEGSYDVTGSAGLTPGTDDQLTVEQWLAGSFAGTFLEEPAREFAARWAHVTPWVRPVWMTGWDFLFAVLALLSLVTWGVAELVYNRRRITARARSLAG